MSSARTEKRKHLRVTVNSQAMEVAVAVVRVLEILKSHSNYVEDKVLKIICEHLRS